MTVPSTRGSTIGPPALIAYAVEPVGVANTAPSALISSRGILSTKIRYESILAGLAVRMTTSFVAHGSTS